jgi:SAM-dependent methyltransferase
MADPGSAGRKSSPFPPAARRSRDPTARKRSTPGTREWPTGSALPSLYRPPNCLLCDERAVVPSRRFPGLDPPVWDCLRCDVAFVWPRPTEAALTEAYQGYGATQISESDADGVEPADGFVQEALGESENGGARTLLDVGCSSGRVLAAALRRGWRAEGIEIDGPTAHETARRLGAVVHHGPAVPTLRSLGQYDLVVASHVLEHLVDPRGALEELRRHLAPRGYLLVRLPNARSRAATLLRRRWNWFRPPLHLTYFSPATLEFAARRWGLSWVRRELRRGDAHLFPTELLLAAARATGGEGAFGSACTAHDERTAAASRMLTWIDGRFPARDYLTARDDSEVAALFRVSG